ncbi:MAG TPA: hypothetical protein VIX59_15905 [Candidatus Binataceae bacterium]
MSTQFISEPLFNNQNHAPDVADLCEAMFVEASRILGFGLTDEIPPAAFDQIMAAAKELAERLGNLIRIQASGGIPTELGN